MKKFATLVSCVLQAGMALLAQADDMSKDGMKKDAMVK
jgi:pentapeptide MXKDX repeat protein